MAAADRPRILVVEDEDSLREGLCDVLVYHGWTPVPAATGEEGLSRGLAVELDLAILDVMLPGLSGFDVCARLREARPDLAILMLTAKGAEDDVVRGLRGGADDYVTKPFSLRELVARVEALLRRARRDRDRDADAGAFSFGPFRVDPATLLATSDGASVELTPREVAILALLAREAGRVVSRRTLLVEVWGLQNVDEIETRTVDVHLAKLRRKLEPASRSLLRTVRGAGYRFSP